MHIDKTILKKSFVKYLQGLLGPAISQINKNYIPSNLPGNGEFKNFCFVSIAKMVSVSRAFVYNTVGINKLPSLL